MRKRNILLFAAWLLLMFVQAPAAGADKAPIIGDSVGTYTLAPENQKVVGLTFDEISKEAPRLFALDESGKIFVYGLNRDDKGGFMGFDLRQVLDIPQREGKTPLESPRGLAFSLEDGQPVLYFLNWDDSRADMVSELWRLELLTGKSHAENLSLFVFRIGDRELHGVAYLNGKIFIGFDATGYEDINTRIKRGIIELEWNQAYDGRLDFVRHLPDAGTFPSRDLTAMVMDGARYLWGTVGDEYIFCAEARAGRGIFHFDRPVSDPKRGDGWELAFGDEYLWVSEDTPGPDTLHRVNVTKNIYASSEGPRMLRHLIMTIETTPENDDGNPGKTYHYYSRPYANEQMPNQGVWPKTEKITDVSGHGAVKPFTYDPAGDVSSRQYMGLVEYDAVPSRSYSSRYEVDIWTNPWRRFVYPHLVDLDRTALKGTDYLADDPELFNLTDTETYDNFIQRIEDYIMERYGVPADLKNPYWAVRNALEYIQDHYYYPGRDKRKPAAVDYDREHYDANPGNLKIALSDDEYNKMQIIACSGTSVMLSGYMRYLGFPARWLGTGTEHNPDDWDKNGNNLLDESEQAGVSSGHRYTQVWLGKEYGWICFDATPTRPPHNDYDPIPPAQPQWRFMNRTARGHLKDKRIVFNVGSGLFRPLYRDFEYDEKRAIDNDCGGDQRYNLQGRFDQPELWKMPRQRIMVENLCFIKDIAVTGGKNAVTVSWNAAGRWDLDPDSKLVVIIQRMNEKTKAFEKAAVLMKGIPVMPNSVVLDLSEFKGTNYRVLVRKVGDTETGGHSPVFDLN